MDEIQEKMMFHFGFYDVLACGSYLQFPYPNHKCIHNRGNCQVSVFYNYTSWEQYNIFYQKISQELGHWVKPQSTMWFSKFLLTKYKDDRWVENF